MQPLRPAGADHDVLAIKRNQRTLHAKVRAAFADTERGVFTLVVQESCEIIERTGGRRERRTGPVLGGPGLRSLIRVCPEHHGPRGRPRAVRYGISGLPVDVAALLELVRGHRGVENGLHRTLDVQFREDDGHLRHGPTVESILRRVALP